MRNVVVASGHLTDAPERVIRRFPPSAEPRVRGRIEAALAHWGVGAGDLVVVGGARGTDLLAAEAALGRGADVTLLLALPPEAFVEASVRSAPDDADGWVARFLAVAASSDVRVVDGNRTVTESPFERCNRGLLELALAEAGGGSIHGLLVWDGRHGDDAGGTADIAQALAAAGIETLTIDPRP